MDESVKRCFKCGLELPLSEFYKHPKMADGHVNKCKTCNKRDVRDNRASRREQYAAYEKERNATPERKESALEYQRRRRRRNPEKDAARQKVARGLLSGKVTPAPCESCGHLVVEAHHDDYAKPLDVHWMCFKCHRERCHGQTVMAKQEDWTGTRVDRKSDE